MATHGNIESFVEWPIGTKAIMLLDLDAFFASVEQLDHPEWRGKPVIVGGDADKHGVVSTCSYEARAFGVRSAMPASQAARLCPDAIWTHGHYERYRDMSAQVMDIIRAETPYIEQVSIDEAFADITPTKYNTESPLSVAVRVQNAVAALGITCSIGVGTSKSVAKIASDLDKPKGLTIVPPGTEIAFLMNLPVRAMSGIGHAAETKLKEKGIETLGQLASMSRESARKLLGKTGEVLWYRANGIDEAPMAIGRDAKSISSETTFAHAISDEASLMASILSMAGIVGRRARSSSIFGHRIILKLRFTNRETTSIQHTYTESIDDLLGYHDDLLAMLRELWLPGTPVILVGVTLSQLHREFASQISVGDNTDLRELNNDKRRKLAQATDALKDRFGETSVFYGFDLRNAGNTTSSIVKNSSTSRPDFSRHKKSPQRKPFVKEYESDV